jgi:hypothetical protein
MPYENGEFREPNNDDRAGWAAKAVETFARQTKQLKEGDELPPVDAEGPNDWWEEVLGDLVADLIHLTDRLGIEWGDVVIRGESCHGDEAGEAEDSAQARGTT